MTMTFAALRKKYRRFVYERYEYAFTKAGLEMRFRFSIDPDIVFTPTVVIKGVREEAVVRNGHTAFDNFVFHMGLAEIPSYWKCACPQEIFVACGSLDAAQRAWWRSLILNGLGEFFYVNHIDFTAPGFLRITAPPSPRPRRDRTRPAPRVARGAREGCIVPLGGGKDSLVTAEIMKRSGMPFRTLTMGRAPALRRSALAIGDRAPITITRTIDSRLVALNKKGYLNGHTPFSAYLAFLTVFAAALFGYRSIAISQERSANEANAVYKGRPINHQYSKSYAFEKKFRAYAKRYLADDIAFWSSLRPLYELQIAELFAAMPRYHGTFMSCNVGSRKGTWCGKCPKCATVYILLSPFLPRKAVMKIFRRDLFADRSLWPTVMALLGKTKDKPFECVGTKGEMMIALSLTLERYKKEGQPLPSLLHRFAQSPGLKDEQDRAMRRARGFLASWDVHNATPQPFARVLRRALAAHRRSGKQAS